MRIIRAGFLIPRLVLIDLILVLFILFFSASFALAFDYFFRCEVKLFREFLSFFTHCIFFSSCFSCVFINCSIHSVVVPKYFFNPTLVVL